MHHFEYYSLFLGVKTPLLLQLNGEKKNNHYAFKFENTINLVFKRVNTCLLNVINFYQDFLAGKYDLVEYSEKSGFCLNEKLFFSDLISKHITYLNQFRLATHKSGLLKKYATDSMTNDELLIEFNKKTTKAIKEYIKLFFRLYNKLIIDNPNIPNESLKRTNSAFKNLYRITLLIEKSGYKDIISISTQTKKKNTKKR